VKPPATTTSVDARPIVWPELGSQAVRFAAVGVAATVTHLLTVVALMEGLGLDVASLANGIAVLAGSAVSYCGNYFWAFRSGGRHVDRLPRFAAVYGAAFAFNALVMLVAADLAGIPYLIPLMMVVVATPVLTFLLNRFWVFA
jgi:putative flippase GtrA